MQCVWVWLGEGGGGHARTAAQMLAFLYFLRGSRTRRCFSDPKRRGLGKASIENWLYYILKDVLPRRYPALVTPPGGFGVGAYRELRGAMNKAVHAMFGQSAQVALAEFAYDRVRHDRSSAGEDEAVAEEAARAAADEAVEALRAQTGCPSTRLHATREDLDLVRDTFMTDPLRPNRALVADAYMGFVECAGPRPTSAANCLADGFSAFNHWANRCALTLRNFVESARGILGRARSIGGHGARMQVGAELERGKRRHDQEKKPGEDRYNLTPNAEQMVHCAPARFRRLQMVRGAYKASYAKLDPAAAKALFERVCSVTGFTGLTPELTGYASITEMARACDKSGWARMDPVVDTWAAFPAVGADDAFTQTETAGAEALANTIAAAGDMLGFEPNRFGVWAIRKFGAACIVESGRAFEAAMWLGHSDVHSLSVNAAYLRGSAGLDVGAIEMGEAPQELDNVFGLCQWRAPGSEVRVAHARRSAAARTLACGAQVRRFCEVDEASPALQQYFVDDPERRAAEAKVLEVEGEVLDTLGRSREGDSGRERRPVLSNDTRAALADLGASHLAERLCDARKAHHAAKVKARHAAMVMERRRRYEEANRHVTPLERLKRAAAWRWPQLTEVDAVAFSLQRPRFVGARDVLRALPEPLAAAVLHAGALGLVVDSPSAAAVRMEQSGLFETRCMVCLGQDDDGGGSDAEDGAGTSGWRVLTFDGRGRGGAFAMWCDECERNLADFAARVVTDDARVVDSQVRSMGLPAVDRATYATWRILGGDAYSGGSRALEAVRHRRDARAAARSTGGDRG